MLRWVTGGLLGLMTVGAAPQGAVRGVDEFAGKPRVAVVSDIGNEPDDQMSLVRLLVYSNELEIEALVASTSTWQNTATHPETMHSLIAAYGAVRANLMLHAAGWPEAEALDARVFAGQAGYGLAATGEGRRTAGSDALLRAMRREDDRPLWICLWGGANTLAQALLDLRASADTATMERMVGRLRVSSISDQDDAGPWIRREFPGLEYVVTPSRPNGESYYAATWTGISGDRYYRNGEGADFSVVTNEWLDTHVRGKGPLGAMYPRYLFIMEGDTPSFLGLLDNGLNAYRRPDWGGWGGRYVWLQPYGEMRAIWTQGGDEFMRATSQDEVVTADGRRHGSDQATVWRWREAFQNDFAARMDWTVKDFAHANHAPAVVVNGKAGTGVVRVTMRAGEIVRLDAAGTTDPDGNGLTYRWFAYPEAGLAGGHAARVEISGGDGMVTAVKAVAPCAVRWLELPGMRCVGAGTVHLILAVTDDGEPRLTAYRRVVVTVEAGREGWVF